MSLIPKIRLCSALLVIAATTMVGKVEAQWISKFGLTPAEYQSTFNALGQQGYRLKTVSGYVSEGAERYAALWVKEPGGACQARHGLSSADYQKTFNTLAKQGYRLTWVSGYEVNGTVRYAAIWEQKSGPAWVARHGLNAAQYQQAFNTYTKQGYRLIHVSGYSNQGTATFAAIFEKSSGPTWQARHNLTAAQYQQAFNDFGGQGYRLVDVSGYNVGGTDYYAAIWEHVNGPGFVARNGVPDGSFQGVFDSIVSEGYRQVLITAFQSGSAGKVNGIWDVIPPPPTPSLTIPAFTAKGIGVPDPQIALGHKYLAAIDTSDLVFYDKATLQPVPVGPGFAYPSNPVRVTALFNKFFDQLNKQMNLPANVCDTTHPQSGFPGGNFDNLYDANHPDAAVPGCIYEAYDTRVLYDDVRHRFWIEAAVRNLLWVCPAKDNPLHAETGDHVCHTEWNPSWAHRFIVIAVSQVDSSGQEDLSKPFHQYALVDDYQDWPLMTVHDDYLVLTHLDFGAKIQVFNAQALADGVQDNSAMATQPLIKEVNGSIAAWYSEPGKAPVAVTAVDPAVPVNIHGDSKGITYFVSTKDNYLTVYGFKAPPNNPVGPPQLLAGAAVNLGHTLGNLRHNPVFRNGKIYLATYDCKKATNNACVKYISRILIVPAGLGPDGKSVQAFGPGSAGFRDLPIGDDSSDLSYELPAVEVTAEDNLAVMFERAGVDPAHPSPPSVRYTIFYSGVSGFSPSQPLHDSVGTQVPNSLDPSGAGVVDLGAIVLDPGDGKVWMSHAYSNDGSYQEVIGAVKP